jgi:hypothetical protein
MKVQLGSPYSAGSIQGSRATHRPETTARSVW